MQRDNQRLVPVCSREFVRQPLLLNRVDGAMFRHVRVQTNNGDKRAQQREEHVRLRHGDSRCVLRRWIHMGLCRHKVRDPAVERNLRPINRGAVVVARDCDNGRGVGIVRFVELAVVFAQLAVEIDDVAQMVEETWLGSRQAQIGLHRIDNVCLVVRVFYAAGVTRTVKDDLAIGGSLCPDARKNRFQVVVVRRLSQRRRQWLKTLCTVGERRNGLNTRVCLGITSLRTGSHLTWAQHATPSLVGLLWTTAFVVPPRIKLLSCLKDACQLSKLAYLSRLRCCLWGPTIRSTTDFIALEGTPPIARRSV